MTDAWTSQLRFFRIDEDCIASLKGFRKAAEKHLAGILDRFYAHLSATPEAAPFIGAPGLIDRLKKLQAKHWMKICDGQFDESYRNDVRAIGLAHARIGVPPTLFLGGYSFIGAELLEKAHVDLAVPHRAVHAHGKAALIHTEQGEANEARREAELAQAASERVIAGLRTLGAEISR